MPWYIIQTYSGHEKKVRLHLEEIMRSEGRQEHLKEVRIPTQKVTEVRDGKRRTTERTVYPGYLFLHVAEEANIAEDPENPSARWLLPYLKQTPGVMGFLPNRSDPSPLQEHEIPGLYESEESLEPEPIAHIEYGVDDMVRVIDGPFSGFIGKVNNVDMAKQKLKLTISIFGRETPVELDFLQVERNLGERDG